MAQWVFVIPNEHSCIQILGMVSVSERKKNPWNSYRDGEINLFQLFEVCRQPHYIYKWGLNSLEAILETVPPFILCSGITAPLPAVRDCLCWALPAFDVMHATERHIWCVMGKSGGTAWIQVCRGLETNSESVYCSWTTVERYLCAKVTSSWWPLYMTIIFIIIFLL